MRLFVFEIERRVVATGHMVVVAEDEAQAKLTARLYAHEAVEDVDGEEDIRLQPPKEAKRVADLPDYVRDESPYVADLRLADRWESIPTCAEIAQALDDANPIGELHRKTRDLFPHRGAR